MHTIFAVDFSRFVFSFCQFRVSFVARAASRFNREQFQFYKRRHFSNRMFNLWSFYRLLSISKKTLGVYMLSFSKENSLDTFKQPFC